MNIRKIKVKISKIKMTTQNLIISNFKNRFLSLLNFEFLTATLNFDF